MTVVPRFAPASLAHARRARAVARGLRSGRRDPVTLDEAMARVRRDVERRAEHLVEVLDLLVWSVPASPYLPLLRHAGIARDDVRALVAEHGVEEALAVLRDEGVYVAFREWLGATPIVRGSLTFDVQPHRFANPRFPPDLLGSTSGTRSGGTAVSLSFANLRHGALLERVTAAVWDIAPGPFAMWLPVLPAGAGVNTMLRHAATGRPPQRWFTQLDPATPGIRADKRLATRVLPLLGRLTGVPLPPPEHVPTTDPAPVLAWCAGALQRDGAATIAGYASSMVRLCDLAVDRAVPLRGLTVLLTGEPMSAAKVAAIRNAGAVAVNRYAFMQFGGAGISCPCCGDEDLHVWDGDVAVVERRLPRRDGHEMPLLLWTSLQPESRSVLLNVENDDAGELRRDIECDCPLGELGHHTRLQRVRGVSKMVAGGVTVAAARFSDLVEAVLPQRFGGGATDYQFAEVESAGATKVRLRIDPRVGPVDDGAVWEEVSRALRREEPGLLAAELWSDDGFEVRREPVRPARSGKILAFEPLVAPPTGFEPVPPP